jgi:hypothetical protein
MVSMDAATLSNYFFESLVESSVLFSNDVKYSAVKTYLEMFVRIGLISENEIVVKNDKLVDAIEIFRIIFNNLNLTDEETNVLLKRVDDYIFAFILSFYKNMDRTTIKNKKSYFLYNILKFILNSIKSTEKIFGIPLYDFFIRFLKETKMFYDEKYAEFVYQYLHNVYQFLQKFDPKHPYEDKLTREQFENFLISNWVEYAKVVLNKSNVFGTNLNSQ